MITGEDMLIAERPPGSAVAVWSTAERLLLAGAHARAILALEPGGAADHVRLEGDDPIADAVIASCLLTRQSDDDASSRQTA